jgi:hypothetical protein
VLLDGPGRCPDHRQPGWDRWKSQQPPEKLDGYGHRWTRFRAAILAERGERCEHCGATDVRLPVGRPARGAAPPPGELDSTHVRAAVAVLLLVLALAACGGSSSNGESGKPAQQIVQDAVKAAQSANSVRMSGSIPGPSSSLSVDLRVAKPSSATGTIALEGNNVTIVRVGDTVYLNGDRGFWTRLLGAAAGKRFAGRWLKASASASNVAGFARLTDINQFFKGAVQSHGTLVKKGTKTFDRRQVIAIVDTGQGGGTLYVAAQGKPYPVALLGGTAAAKGTIRFADWNANVSVTAPTGAVPLPLG